MIDYRMNVAFSGRCPGINSLSVTYAKNDSVSGDALGYTTLIAISQITSNY